MKGLAAVAAVLACTFAPWVASAECFFARAEPRDAVTTRAGVSAALAGSQVVLGDRVVNRCNGLPESHPSALVPFRDGVAIAFRSGATYLATPTSTEAGVAFERLAASDLRGDLARAFDAKRRALAASGPSRAKPSDPHSVARGTLPAEHVTALAVHGAHLVVATFDRGLFTVDAAGEAHDVAGGPRHVNALLATSAGLYIGTTRGLFLATTLGERPPARVALDIPDPHVNGMAEGRDGTVWLATSSGLVGLRPGDPSPRVLGARDGVPSPLVYAVTETADGALWVGTARGVARIFQRDVATYGVENGKLPHDWVTALLADGNGVFVGTYNAGVVHLGERGDARVVARFRDAWVNPNGLVRVASDVMAATLGGGLVGLSAVPLPDDDVTAAVTYQGALWIGTRGGLTRIAPK